jgi:hypothetical protein
MFASLPAMARNPSTSWDDLKQEYRRLLMKTHPDRGGAADNFVRLRSVWAAVQQAFAVKRLGGRLHTFQEPVAADPDLRLEQPAVAKPETPRKKRTMVCVAPTPPAPQAVEAITPPVPQAAGAITPPTPQAAEVTAISSVSEAAQALDLLVESCVVAAEELPAPPPAKKRRELHTPVAPALTPQVRPAAPELRSVPEAPPVVRAQPDIVTTKKRSVLHVKITDNAQKPRIATSELEQSMDSILTGTERLLASVRANMRAASAPARRTLESELSDLEVAIGSASQVFRVSMAGEVAHSKFCLLPALEPRVLSLAESEILKLSQCLSAVSEKKRRSRSKRSLHSSPALAAPAPKPVAKPSKENRPRSSNGDTQSTSSGAVQGKRISASSRGKGQDTDADCGAASFAIGKKRQAAGSTGAVPCGEWARSSCQNASTSSNRQDSSNGSAARATGPVFAFGPTTKRPKTVAIASVPRGHAVAPAPTTENQHFLYDLLDLMS